MEQQLDCALDLMRRLPPQKIEKNLTDLIDLVSTFLFGVSFDDDRRSFESYLNKLKTATFSCSIVSRKL